VLLLFQMAQHLPGVISAMIGSRSAKETSEAAGREEPEPEVAAPDAAAPAKHTALTHEELIARLDKLPVFTLMKDGAPAEVFESGRAHFFVDPDDAFAAADGRAELNISAVGLGQALRMAMCGHRLIASASDLAAAKTLKCKEPADWESISVLPLFACHALQQDHGGMPSKPLFMDHADAKTAVAGACEATGHDLAQLEIVVVPLQRLAKMLLEGVADASKMHFVGSSGAFRRFKEVSIKWIAYQDKQRKAKAKGKAATPAGAEQDEPPPLE